MCRLKLDHESLRERAVTRGDRVIALIIAELTLSNVNSGSLWRASAEVRMTIAPFCYSFMKGKMRLTMWRTLRTLILRVLSTSGMLAFSQLTSGSTP